MFERDLEKIMGEQDHEYLASKPSGLQPGQHVADHHDGVIRIAETYQSDVATRLPLAQSFSIYPTHLIQHLSSWLWIQISSLECIVRDSCASR
jgi:hypothetical protein